MSDKKLITLVAILLILAFIAGRTLREHLNLANQNASISSSESTTPLALHEEYPSLPESNRIIRESSNDIIKRYEQGTGIIFLGFKECPWCQKLIPILNEAAETEGVNVYYLDIKDARQNNSLEYHRITSILSPHLKKDEEGLPRVTVPDVSFMRDGEITWRYEKEPSTEEENTPSSYWTTQRKERAIERFREEMKKLNKEDANERV